MQFAFIIGTPGPALVRRLVESSDPDDLTNRILAVFGELLAIGNVFVAAVNLSAAGDGDKWVVEIVAAPAANLMTLDGTTPLPVAVQPRLGPGFLDIRCYKASDVRELAVQRDRALESGVPSITLEAMAGSSQGLQYMGLIIIGE